MECFSLYLFITYCMLCNCHITCLACINYQVPPWCYCATTFPNTFFFVISTLYSLKEHWTKWEWRNCPGNYPLVYIQPRTPALFTSFNLHCHPCVSYQWAAVSKPCHNKRAVLPSLTAVPCHATLTLIAGKVPFKCQWVSNTLSHIFVFSCVSTDKRGERANSEMHK